MFLIVLFVLFVDDGFESLMLIDRSLSFCQDGVAILCPSHLYIIDNFTISDYGELQELEKPSATSNFSMQVMPSVDPVCGISASLVVVQSYEAKRNRPSSSSSNDNMDSTEDEDDDQSAFQKIALKDLREIHKRRYQLQNVGIEFFLRLVISNLLSLILFRFGDFASLMIHQNYGAKQSMNI